MHQIVNRYELHEKLGEGGMGVVYRATDHLTGDKVALKQILIKPQQLWFHSESDSDETDALRLALAQEFQILASLRHPNIINVLDYGFDDLQQPFFTMNLLDNAQTLRDALPNLTIDEKINIVIQVLQALAYLHRRGILHRDIKARNVMVDENGIVRVLDFGLAAAVDFDDEHRGTFVYMAPECLQGHPTSVASDLYAVGVLLFWLLTGTYPFSAARGTDLYAAIIKETPDWNLLQESILDHHAPNDDTEWHPIVAVIQRLLAKNPADRYPDAYSVITNLSTASKHPQPSESFMIRESFLQAATFVGRKTELSALESALTESRAGHGSLWLVGGESGVGKTRLLNELRIRALIQGVSVIRGQGAEQGGLSYQLWRDVLPHLILATEISDIEAGILKPLVPMIEQLLNRPIPNMPELGGEANQQRLVAVIVDLLKRQTQPIVLLFEDLQWADESLNPLKQIAPLIQHLPMLIVGNYRRDESPDLPEEFDLVQTLMLERLTTNEMTALSVSMIGAAGENDEVIELLQRETEGNVFFLVEVVRALAESAGQLAQIGLTALPEQVQTGGVQAILQQRIDRLPTVYEELLQIAALAGRQIDIEILETTQHNQALAAEIDNFLRICADIAIMDVQENQWRFSHDKLREYVRDSIAVDESPQLHGRIAEAIETVYPNNDDYTFILADHWQHAQNAAKERYYADRAGNILSQRGLYHDSMTYHERALELATSEIERLKAQAGISHGHLQIADDYEGAIQLLTSVLDGLDADAYPLMAATVLGDLALAHSYATSLSDALPFAYESIEYCQKAQDSVKEATGWYNLASIYTRRGDYEKSLEAAERGLELLPEDNITVRAILYLSKNNPLTKLGYYDEAIAVIEQTIPLLEQIGDRHGMAKVYNDLGTIAGRKNDSAAAVRYFQQTHDIYESLNMRSGMAIALVNMGICYKKLGDYQRGSECYEAAYPILQETGMRFGEAVVLVNWANLLEKLGDDETALKNARESLRVALEVDAQNLIMVNLATFARLAKNAGDLERSVQLAYWSYHYPNEDVKAKEDAQEVLNSLKELMTQEEFDAVVAIAETLDVDTVIQELIAE